MQSPEQVPDTLPMVPRRCRREQAERFAHELRVQRFLQPDVVTCGPACLRKVYGLSVSAEEVLIDRNEDGDTLAVFLGIAGRRRADLLVRPAHLRPHPAPVAAR